MNIIKNLLALASIVMLSSPAHSQSREPELPSLITTYTIGLRDRTTGQPLPQGNWAFDVRIKNPNNRAIYCPKASFIAYLDRYNDQCDSMGDIGIPLNFGNTSGGGLELKANEQFGPVMIGFDERIAMESNLGIGKLEYCSPRGPWVAECGFNCDDRKFDEVWEESINTDGHKKYKCGKDGNKFETEVFCAKGYKPGDVWQEGITNGTKTYACQPNGSILTSYSCTQSPAHSLTADNRCVPASCGSTPHGVRGNRAETINGYYDSVCDHGSWSDTQLNCNPNAFKENGSCRAARSCDGYPHLGTKTTFGKCGTCASGPGITKAFSCQDGAWILTSSSGFCSPVVPCGGRPGERPN